MIETPSLSERHETDPPFCCASWGWNYHHTGIPVTHPLPGGRYLPHLALTVEGFSRSPFGIEFMRFEAGNTMPEILRRLPHVAFQVPDLRVALDRVLSLPETELLIAPTRPCPWIEVAMFSHRGAPIECLAFADMGNEVSSI